MAQQQGGLVEWFDALAHTVTADGDWPRCAECGEYGSHDDCQPEAAARVTGPVGPVSADIELDPTEDEATTTVGVDAAVSTADARPGGISAPMVAALESAWSAIRARHPEVPAVVIVLGGGSVGQPGMLKLGHFAALRWRNTPAEHNEDTDAATGDVAPLGEVFVGGEGLARGPVGVLGTLLHEAAHALADVRGIKDTSRQGRWHNARFKALAEELGIEVTKDPKLGWSPTTVTDQARADYAEVVDELSRALRMQRAIDGVGFGLPIGRSAGDGQDDTGEDGDEASGKRKSTPACVCGCGRRIRVAPSVLALGPIECGVCEQPFTPDIGEHAAGGETGDDVVDADNADADEPADEDSDQDWGEGFEVAAGVAS